MDFAAIAQVLLRLAHALAAVVWLGGGLYYLVGLRPLTRQSNPEVQAVAGAAQRAYGEWTSVATVVMVVTGVVLMFDRVSGGLDSVTYALVLAIKILAAVVAFWFAGVFARQRRRRKRKAGQGALLDRAWLVLILSTIAFVMGVVLSTVYPTAAGSR